MMLQRDHRSLRGQIRVMWENGLDTVDMAKELQLSEALIERELHAALELKRSIVKSLVKE